jgi:hypothetical protein
VNRAPFAPTHGWPPSAESLAASHHEAGDRHNALPEWVYGRFVDVTFSSAGSADLYVPHGLGRAWRGAWVVSNTAPGNADPRVGAPEAARPYELRVVLASAADATVRCWVY